MGNSFGGGHRSVDISNSGTEVFLSILQFAVSDLAVSPWERELAQWIAWHDQNLVGSGTVGFDLEDIAWATDARATDQQRFLLTAVRQARSRYRWDELCCDPNPAFVDRWLTEYHDIVVAFAPDGTAPRRGYGWPDAEDRERRCPNHRVHCSDVGWCRVCACGSVPA